MFISDSSSTPYYTIGPTSGDTWGDTTTLGNTTYAPVSPSIDGSLSLYKTGEGQFVLTGENAQQLLFEYFSQAPELWLKLMAVQAEKEAETDDG